MIYELIKKTLLNYVETWPSYERASYQKVAATYNFKGPTVFVLIELIRRK